jgi:hypothetical protein
MAAAASWRSTTLVHSDFPRAQQLRKLVNVRAGIANRGWMVDRKLSTSEQSRRRSLQEDQVRARRACYAVGVGVACSAVADPSSGTRIVDAMGKSPFQEGGDREATPEQRSGGRSET